LPELTSSLSPRLVPSMMLLLLGYPGAGTQYFNSCSVRRILRLACFISQYHKGCTPNKRSNEEHGRCKSETSCVGSQVRSLSVRFQGSGARSESFMTSVEVNCNHCAKDSSKYLCTIVFACQLTLRVPLSVAVTSFHLTERKRKLRKSAFLAASLMASIVFISRRGQRTFSKVSI
jgi:hypothetical protein